MITPIHLWHPPSDQNDQNSSSTIEPQSVNGKRSGQDPIPPNAKQAKRDKPTVTTQLPISSQPTYPVITHKHTPSARQQCERYELKIDYITMDQVCTWSQY